MINGVFLDVKSEELSAIMRDRAKAIRREGNATLATMRAAEAPEVPAQPTCGCALGLATRPMTAAEHEATRATFAAGFEENARTWDFAAEHVRANEVYHLSLGEYLELVNGTARMAYAIRGIAR